jgi:hypothetical protein
MATCPFFHQEALRISMAITQAEVIKNILRHLKLAADPPPIAYDACPHVYPGPTAQEAAAHFWHTATLQP